MWNWIKKLFGNRGRQNYIRPKTYPPIITDERYIVPPKAKAPVMSAPIKQVQIYGTGTNTRPQIYGTGTNTRPQIYGTGTNARQERPVYRRNYHNECNHSSDDRFNTGLVTGMVVASMMDTDDHREHFSGGGGEAAGGGASGGWESSSSSDSSYDSSSCDSSYDSSSCDSSYDSGGSDY